MIAGTADLADFDGLEERIAADTSSSEPTYLLLGRAGSQIRVSESAHQLLALAARHDSTASLARELSARSARPVGAGDVERKLAELLKQLRAAEARAEQKERPPGFWLRLPLASSPTVTRLAQRLAWAFHPGAAALILGGIAMAVVALLRDPAMAGPSAAGDGFWAAYTLFFLSLLVHELGHAAACCRWGGQPSEIGLTVYLLFPALYSDVSTAWRLRRWQRVIVDLGGTYLQLAVGALYVAAYRSGAGPAFRTAFLMILYTNLFSLNPIFKFDGYWLVADALGVVNLSRQPARLARWVADALRGKPPRPLGSPPAVAAALAVYSVLSVGTWAYFLWRLVPWLESQLTALPGETGALIQGLAQRNVGATALAAQRLALSTAMAVLALATLMGALRGLKGRWQAGRRSQAARTK